MKPSPEVAERLTNARKTLDLTQSEFAEKLKIHPSTISLWEKSKNELTALSALAIEKVFNISAEWLLEGKGEMMADMPFWVPVVNLRPSAGSGKNIPDRLEEKYKIALSQKWLQQTLPNIPPEYLAFFEIEGDSMSPTLEPTDLLFVDVRTGINPSIREGVWVLRVEDKALVKRVRLTDQGYVAISDNKDAYPDQIKLDFKNPKRFQLLALGLGSMGSKVFAKATKG